jgi:hypothetical protein
VRSARVARAGFGLAVAAPAGVSPSPDPSRAYARACRRKND